ncbi:Polyadenylate-binding protein RBP47 [Acorus gramineus]|uniref:Polyadenylate-binding protein RBP47 n=1 Tax=Acorus gramineus TaxID=55184 RepID=A0AAV9B779_ACOGR|nr:Polyadenylate-binding protein RBP47 [Acorus gramineus]
MSAILNAGLSRDTNEIALRDAFKQHGDIVKVRVVCDRVTSNSKRYGFISFTSESEARTAIQKMDGQN